MIGNVIQEYLVSLGFHVDKPGFNAMNQTIQQTTNVVQKATGSWAKSFLAASGIVTTSLAGITSALLGVTKAAASEDLQMQKLGRNMMIGKDAAWSMKKATDALGESMTDIMLTPELAERFHKLVEDGNRMKVGGDFAETMKGFRDLMFQFTRLKQEVSYAMTWVGYYIMKYLSRPLAEAEAKFRTFNDKFVANMSTWTEKAARAAVYIINIGLHFVQFLVRMKKEIGDMWGAFPRGVRIAIAAVAILSAVIKASPLGRMIQLVSILLLLIDDYFGYFEGKDALLGKYWEKLDKVLNRAKEGIIDLGNAAEPVLETAREWLEKGAKSAEEFGQKLMDIGGRIGSSNSVQRMGQSIRNLGGALADFSLDQANSSLDVVKKFIKACEKYRITEQLYKAVDNLADSLSNLSNVLTDALKWLDDLYMAMADSEELDDFIDAVGELVSAFLDLFNAIWKLVNDCLGDLIGKTDEAASQTNIFRESLKLILKVMAGVIRGLSWMIRLLAKFIKQMTNDRRARSFWADLGKSVRNFGKIFADVIDFALKKMSRFGRALNKLIHGDFKGALNEALGKDTFGGSGNSGKGDQEWNKKVVYNRFKEAGYNDDAIAGIMGRMQQEHGFDTSDAPEHYVDGIGWLGGYGMFQWTGSRKDDFLTWCSMNGRDPQDPGTQSDYAIIEAGKRGMGPDVMNTMNYEQAANAWTKDWEVGAPGDEVAYAAEYLQRIQNGDFVNKPGGYGSVGGQDGEPLLPAGLKVWHSEGGTTDVSGFQPGMSTFLNELADAATAAGVTFTITGGTEPGHADGEFSHANGYKVDIDDQITDEQKAILMKVLSKYAHEITHEADKGHYDITVKNDDQWGLGDYASYGIGKIRGAFGGNGLVDPVLMRGFVGTGNALVPSGVGAGTTIIQNTVSVGGVNVSQPNASADEIGSAVGQKTIEALNRRGQYLVCNRAMTGGPILT